MTRQQDPDIETDLDDLLTADRELTEAEMDRLRRLSDQEWTQVTTTLFRQARRSYAVAAPDQFANCVTKHMVDIDYAEMINSDVFRCPHCDRLLKDRGTAVGEALSLERQRLADLLVSAEGADAGSIEAQQRWNRLRTALGIPRHQQGAEQEPG